MTNDRINKIEYKGRGWYVESHMDYVYKIYRFYSKFSSPVGFKSIWVDDLIDAMAHFDYVEETLSASFTKV